MNPILLIGIIVAICVITFIALSIPFAKHSATMDAYGLLDEPAAAESHTRASD